MKRSVYGVGYNSDKKNYNSKHKGYKTWSDMLKRCYCEKYHSYHRYGGNGVKVSNEWHDFAVFAHWFDKNYTKGYVLDKDLLKPQNKVYCEEFCRFIPKRLNVLLTSYKRKENGLPCSVSKNKVTGKYKMVAVLDGKYKTKGGFNNPEDAFNHYKMLRQDYIINESSKMLTDSAINSEVHEAVTRWECPRYSL